MLFFTQNYFLLESHYKWKSSAVDGFAHRMLGKRLSIDIFKSVMMRMTQLLWDCTSNELLLLHYWRSQRVFSELCALRQDSKVYSNVKKFNTDRTSLGIHAHIRKAKRLNLNIFCRFWSLWAEMGRKKGVLK